MLPKVLPTIFLNKLSCGEDVGKQKRQPTDKQLIAFDLSDLAGVRTLDPLLKREMQNLWKTENIEMLILLKHIILRREGYGLDME